jgi:hypothetical protein
MAYITFYSWCESLFASLLCNYLLFLSKIVLTSACAQECSRIQQKQHEKKKPIVLIKIPISTNVGENIVQEDEDFCVTTLR